MKLPLLMLQRRSLQWYIRLLMSALIKQFRIRIESQPELGIHFNPPLKLNAIQKFESKYGWELPDAVREMLTVFNGESSLSAGACAGFNFCSLDTMMKCYSISLDVAETVEQRVVPHWAPFLKQEHSWSPDWIPIAEFNCCSDIVYLDPSPSTKGKVGQIFSRDDEHCISGVKAIGVEHLLRTIVSNIEAAGAMPRFGRLPDFIKTTA